LASVNTAIPKNEPGRFGEFKFATWISEAASDDTNLWFNVNHLYGVGEIDALVSHPSFGFLVVEVKGHSINQVTGYSGDGRHVAFGDARRKNPALQAHEQAQKLKGWFSSQRSPVRAPWVHSLSIWPNIRRSDWAKRFGDGSVAARDSEFMGFEEDLVHFDKFLERANSIIRSPRFGATPPARVFDVDAKALRHYVDTLRDGSDLELPVRPETGEVAPGFRFSSSGTQSQQLPQHWDAKRLVVEGPAGSGKTQTLLRVGLEHLTHGRRVLFCCFNKTLAAEVRRELAGKAIGTPDSEFLAFDYFELAKFLQPTLKVLTVASDENKYGEYLQGVAKATRVDQVDAFDVVLLDESQDITDEQWELVQSVCAKETYLAIAMGKRQELYRDEPCEAVARWAEKAQRSKLQRRFRDAAQGYFVGQAFSHMNFLSEGIDSAESIRWMEQQKTKNSSQNSKVNQLDFGVAENAGSVIRVSTAATVQEDVRELVGKMAKHKEPVNALIILSGRKSPAYRWVIEQLQSLELKFFDLIRPENRRISPPRSAIRITTAHSARGLEADYVLVLDFERICEWLEIGHRLSYIALSRSRIETTVSRVSGVGPYLSALLEISSAYDRTA